MRISKFIKLIINNNNLQKNEITSTHPQSLNNSNFLINY
jgi:hypothetical protein